MKTSYCFVLALLFLVCFSCSNDDDSPPACPGQGIIGNETLSYTYFNSGTPNVTSQPISEGGSIFYENAFAQPVNNGVDIVIPGVRIRTDDSNFEITRIKIEEKTIGDECFVVQNEFNNAQTSFQTDIATVLVLDMSSSLSDNINELKDYAKNFATTVVNSSDDSTVAVVFFSDRDNIFATNFYTADNIQQLINIIDVYSGFAERTALYEAVQTGIELLENLNFDGIKSLVAFTDGGDNDSNNPSALLAQINSSEIEKFAIGLRGADFQSAGLEAIVNENSNFVVADNIIALENIFRIVAKGVVSIYEIRYTRSDQLLSEDETIEIRFSFQSERIN
ncbi:MAG: vWA domain-containing protein [Bacteroidota bacterium]